MELEFNGGLISGPITCRMLLEAQKSVGFGLQEFDSQSIEAQLEWQAAVIAAWLRKNGQTVTADQVLDWGMRELRTAGQALVADLVGELEAPVTDEAPAVGDPFGSGTASSGSPTDLCESAQASSGTSNTKS